MCCCLRIKEVNQQSIHSRSHERRSHHFIILTKIDMPVDNRNNLQKSTSESMGMGYTPPTAEFKE